MLVGLARRKQEYTRLKPILSKRLDLISPIRVYHGCCANASRWAAHIT